MPADFYDWMLMHTGTLQSDMVRTCARARAAYAMRRLRTPPHSHSLTPFVFRALHQLRCGWSFRGVFAASSASIRKHRPGFYANLEEQLSVAVFPVAGMYMERMWRRILLCAPSLERGSGSARVIAAVGGNATAAAEYTQRRGGKPMGRGVEEARRR
jgi:hypothetical protein